MNKNTRALFQYAIQFFFSREKNNVEVIGVLYGHGSKEELVKAGAVLLAQIQAGGTGLNIQSASVVIMCEPQMKPSLENQAISRAYRMGQARNVLVYRLLCDESIDERIIEMLAAKQAEFDAFADDSVSAAATAREDVELDEMSVKKMVADEIERINAKKPSAN